MIDEKQALKFCKDEIAKIENYDKAIDDTTQTWVCHHRLGLTLDGEFAHSREELKRMGMYWHRPYFELIFLTLSEHMQLHNKGENNPFYGKTHSEEVRKRISEANKGENHPFYGKTSPMKGRHHSTETRKKMSEAAKGIKHGPFTEEHRRNLSEAHKGKNKGKIRSEETRKMISESLKGRQRSEDIRKKISESVKANWARRHAAERK